MKRFANLISHFFSPFSLAEGLGVRLLLATLFLASCAKDNGDAEHPTGQTTGRTIRKEITLQTTPMLGSAGEGVTRATTQMPLSEDEARIYNLTVLQFGGTTAESVLIKSTEVDVSDINTTTGAFYFDFEEPAGGGESKVFLAVNCNTDLPSCIVNTTTLGEFESATVGTYFYTEDQMESYGLPMLASQSFDVSAANPAPFKLKCLVAKVVFSFDTTTDFKYKSGTLCYKNVTMGTPVIESVPGSAAWRPAGVSFGMEIPLISGGEYTGEAKTVYLPENLSGKMATITKDSDRGGKPGTDVPSEALFIQLSTDGLPNNMLGGLDYMFYLGDGTLQDFNVVRHHQYNVHVTLRGASTTDKRIKLNAANCYMVNTSNMTHSFLGMVMGNGAVTPAAGAHAPEIVPAALRPASVKVLWEQSDPTGSTNAVGDVVKTVSTDGSFITFTTGTKPGNAVIGAFDDGGTLIWSWHIWRPALNPGDAEYYVSNNGGRTFTMMGLNLGAFNNNVNDVKAYGLHYQWGRKDPFPGATEVKAADQTVAAFGGVVVENGFSFAAVSTLTGITVQGGIQTPMNFYYDEQSSHNDDWLQDWNDNLWGTPYTDSSVTLNPNLGSKSIYDPCPLGYRVPPQDTWTQATTSNSIWATGGNGYQLGVGTGATPTTYFYPAAGTRWGDVDKGNLMYTGTIGYYCSSSPPSYGTSGVSCLYFTDRTLRPLYSSLRANGMSVRCMQE